MTAKTGPVHAADDVLARLLADLGREEAVARARVNALTESAPPKVLEERGVLLRKARVIELRSGLLGRVRVVVGEDTNRLGHVDRFDVRPGGTVHLLQRGEDGAASVVGHGVVVRRRRGELHLMFESSDAVSDLDNGDVVDLLVGFDEVTIRRLRDGVGRARRSTGRAARLVEHLLGTVAPRATKLPTTSTVIDDDTTVKLGLSLVLNADQRLAAAHALLAPDVALVHGPPGTGKTRVLVDVVVAAVARGERVLCLCASNAAVDHLALSLLAHQPDLALARFGDPARAHEALEDHTLYGLTQHHPHRVLAKGLIEQAHKLLRGARRRSDSGREAWQRERDARFEANGLFADARRLESTAAVDVLAKIRVLCGTLTGRLDELVDADNPFTLLVVDEASQALTPALLLPLSLLGPEGHVVLAGDHKQLPPVVMADDAKALKVTAFSALRDSDVKHGAFSHMLTVQHRMHELLMWFPSERFYAGALVAHPSVATTTLATNDDAGIALPARVLDVIDTAGAGLQETRPSESSSIDNAGEARVVAMLVRDLIDRGVVGVDEIGVITPYSAQSARLQRELGPFIDGGLEVDSVDGFQGREKRVIIFSAVRSSDRGEVGFLGDERRLNVAITRAKQKLVVIGDSATLSADPNWRALFDHAIAIDSYRSVFEIDGALG